MKKNSMRLAAMLLVLVMITTVGVGGTFAKYTTTGTYSDKAVVAYWGFGSSRTDFELFGDQNENVAEYRLVDGEQVDVIAPGTEGSADVKFVFTNGTDGITAPEVAYNITAEATVVGGPNGYGTFFFSDLKSGIRFYLKSNDLYFDRDTAKFTNPDKNDDGVMLSADQMTDALCLSIVGSGQGSVYTKDYAPNDLPEVLKDGGVITIEWDIPFEAGPGDGMQTDFLGNKADTFEPLVITIKTTATQID